MTITAQEAAQFIKSNDHVFIHSAAAAPFELIRAMTARHYELSGVKIYQLHTEGIAPYAEPGMEKSFEVNAFFIGANTRNAIQNGRGTYIPVFLSEVPSLFRKNIIPLDVALINVSPPDQHGYCSLGTSVDISLSAVQNAKIVIAQINKHMPRTHGDSIIHKNRIHYSIYHDEEIPGIEDCTPTPEELLIGKHIANIVDDGATLQMGIGSIPNAVLSCLNNHKNLGIHTEMFSDGIIPLVEQGVINGSKKAIHPHTIVSSFVVGSKKLYDFIDDNPSVKMLDFSYVNNTDVIRRNPKVTAINSAIEIDLTGQVCADSIGSKMYSGIGGQMDFIRGAALSENGKPIIAMNTLTKNGDSKIVTQLKPGAGVVTTRGHVHYVVTEFGVANLHGKGISERVKELIRIAHPNHRERLEKEAFDARLIYR